MKKELPRWEFIPGYKDSMDRWAVIGGSLYSINKLAFQDAVQLLCNGKVVGEYDHWEDAARAARKHAEKMKGTEV